MKEQGAGAGIEASNMRRIYVTLRSSSFTTHTAPHTPHSTPPRQVLANVISYFIGLAAQALKAGFLALVASFKGVVSEGFTWWKTQARECWNQVMQIVVGTLQIALALMTVYALATTAGFAVLS